MRRLTTLLTLIAGLALPMAAAAHVSEQALVLLLPTDLYITGGVVAVAASILLVALVPGGALERAWRAPRLIPVLPLGAQHAFSLVSTVLFATLVWIGWTGPRDPLSNSLVLMIWTGWWIILVGAVALIGNPWPALNPWSGLYRLLMGASPRALLALPQGVWPAVVLYLAFAWFAIVDPAPTDPARLAVVAGGYWLITMAATIVFGPAWLERGEVFGVLFAQLARVSPFGARHDGRMGLPGWDLGAAPTVSAGVFALVILGAGSFDGFKETFTWMGWMGINPLEFPGRTAVMGSSTGGLLAFTAGLTLAFAAVTTLGALMAGLNARAAFLALAPSILPIAWGYHTAHFWVAFLVDGQYLLAALGDPLARGWNLFGLGDTRVTTGFLNTPDSVRVIWLTQAGVVVAGHILAVLVAHRAALRLCTSPRAAVLLQVPLGAFMIAYTFFGLWLLATPRGM